MKKWYIFLAFAVSVLSVLYLSGRQSAIAQHQRDLNACMEKFEKIRFEAAQIEPVKLYPFEESHQNLGYRDSEGNVVVRPQFTEAHSFSNGRARVTDGLWRKGFIDSKGELVIPHKFVSVTDFVNGLAVFHGTTDDRWQRGVIDLNGNIVLEIHGVRPGLEFYDGFENGRTEVFIYEHEEIPWGLFKAYGNPVPRIHGYVDCTGAVTLERTGN